MRVTGLKQASSTLSRCKEHHSCLPYASWWSPHREEACLPKGSTAFSRPPLSARNSFSPAGCFVAQQGLHQSMTGQALHIPLYTVAYQAARTSGQLGGYRPVGHSSCGCLRPRSALARRHLLPRHPLAPSQAILCKRAGFENAEILPPEQCTFPERRGVPAGEKRMQSFLSA